MNHEYNRMMVERIVEITGYDFLAENKEPNEEEIWTDDDNPSVIRSLPEELQDFLSARFTEMLEKGVYPKTLYDFI